MDRIIEAAGNTLDIKFGVSINNQLTDQILVSVIASDFTDDFDFTVVPTYEKSPILNHDASESEDDIVSNDGIIQSTETPVDDEKPVEEQSTEDDFLPSFLRGKHID